jgi:hypothetical protein
MKAIVFLCGGNETGKTTTLKNLFKDEKCSKYEHWSFFHKKLGDIRIYVVGTDSPQENRKIEFCDIEKVKDNIKKRIEICDRNANGQSYILIVPISINQNEKREELNRRCVLEPIESFGKDFIIFSFCLWKENAKAKVNKGSLLDEIAALTIASRKIETVTHDCDKSRNLLEFIEREVIPRMHAKSEMN